MIKGSKYCSKPQIFAIKLVISLPMLVSSMASEPPTLSLPPSGIKSLFERTRVEGMHHYQPRMPLELWTLIVLFLKKKN